MPDKKPLILITDDEKSIRNSLAEIFEYEGYETMEASNGIEAIEMVEKHKFDLVLLDIKMKQMDGVEALEKIKQLKPALPVIMISGHGNIRIAVDAAKKGASDFIEKPPDLNRLLISVRNALESGKLVRENREIKTKLHGASDIVGESRAIEQVREIIKKVAPSHSRILITGENGTGKELVARSVHSNSPRSSQPFVDVNCAAIPSELIESELFGHEQGAFTGAVKERIGKFEQADGGTLFLDEIGDLHADAQAKLLRALQENEIVRVGGTQNIQVDVRVIAATNKNLADEISENRFREDLFHRLQVIPIHIPPLRERRKDIPLLAHFFLDQLANDQILFEGKTFTDEAVRELKKQPWPGNVRELQNMVERVALLSSGQEISVRDIEMGHAISQKSKNDEKQFPLQAATFQEFKEEAERRYLIQKLNEHDWNISATAEAIDIQRSHIYNKMKKYNIEK